MCNDTQYLIDQIAPLDMDITFSVHVPSEYIIGLRGQVVDNHVATGKMMTATLGRRAYVGFQQSRYVVELMEQNETLHKNIVEAMKTTFQVSAGAVGAIGRLIKHCPRKGEGKNLSLFTMAEIRNAKYHCGFPQGESLLPYSIVDTGDGSEMITLANNSGAGYPTLGKTNNPEVVHYHQMLAHTMHLQLKGMDRKQVEEFCIDDRAKHPYNWVNSGRFKDDTYLKEKILDCAGRYYVLVPLWIRFLLMSVSQPFCKNVKNILQNEPCIADKEIHNAAKMTFVDGGAMKLIFAMQGQLERHGYAYVNMGDDSFFVIKCDDKLLVGSLDGTSFDLTQRAEVMEPIYEAIAEELEYIDPVLAHFYYHIKTYPKTIALISKVTVKSRHCGISGMPMVSEENTMLMSMVLKRLANAMRKYSFSNDEDMMKRCFAKEIDHIGKGVSLKLRVDEIGICDYEGIVRPSPERPLKVCGLFHFLCIYPFLFCGYRFFVDASGAVVCYQDIVRFVKNLSYTDVYIKDNDEYRLYTMVRALGIVGSLGTSAKGRVTVTGHRQLVKEGENVLPLVDGVCLDLIGLMKNHLRDFIGKHYKGKLDMELDSKYLDYMNPLTRETYERTIKGMLATLDRDIFYPKVSLGVDLWTAKASDILDRKGNSIPLQIDFDENTDVITSKPLERIKGVIVHNKRATRLFLDPSLKPEDKAGLLPPLDRPLILNKDRKALGMKKGKRQSIVAFHEPAFDNYEEGLDDYDYHDDYESDDLSFYSARSKSEDDASSHESDSDYEESRFLLRQYENAVEEEDEATKNTGGREINYQKVYSSRK